MRGGGSGRGQEGQSGGSDEEEERRVCMYVCACVRAHMPDEPH